MSRLPRMEKARSIVSGILEEITARASKKIADHSQPPTEMLEAQRAIDDRVMLAFSHNAVPPEYLNLIREALGNDFIEWMEQRGGPLARRGRERAQPFYRKIAMLIERARFLLAQIRSLAAENERLRLIQQELVESQIGFVSEAESMEQQLARSEMLIRIVLEPFEQAMKTVMRFLDAEQFEVFLFDDDRFLSAELKTDGKTFVYNKQDDRPKVPVEVREAVVHEVQQISLDMPLTVEGRHIGHFRISRAINDDLHRDQWQKDVAWITPVLARIIESNRDRIQAQKVYIDDLTQLYNKRKLNEQMGRLYNQFKLGDKELHIAMMDIDRFKALNDKHGHQIGDEILRRAAGIIKEEVPYAYRYGGEEFAGVFYGFDRAQTIEIMERLRSRIEQTPFEINGETFKLTISTGIARFETSMHSVMDAIQRADQALYVSKQDGRNRCTYYDDVKSRLTADVTQLQQELLRMKEQVEQFDRLQQENLRLAEELRRERQRQRKNREETDV